MDNSIIQLLIDNRAKVNILSLFDALENNYDISIIQLLIDNGAKPNDKVIALLKSSSTISKNIKKLIENLSYKLKS